jgi:3-oxoacyl-[acyl-carrier protein] reductase
MKKTFEDRRVFVSGSTAGIGLGIARAFAGEGASVAVNGRNLERLGEVAAELGALAVSADFSLPGVADRAAAEIKKAWGGLDVLICNVGSGRSVPPGTETEEEWQRVLSTNLFAATSLVAACRPLFPPAGGAIVCISSICGVETLGAPVPYSAAKAALNAFVSGIARPLAAQGIRINAVAPGNIHFPGGTWERLLAEDKAKVCAMLDSQVAMKRFGRPEEIADAVLFLASEKSSFITGTVLVVDGGQVRSHL